MLDSFIPVLVSLGILMSIAHYDDEYMIVKWILLKTIFVQSISYEYTHCINLVCFQCVLLQFDKMVTHGLNCKTENPTETGQRTQKCIAQRSTEVYKEYTNILHIGSIKSPQHLPSFAAGTQQ